MKKIITPLFIMVLFFVLITSVSATWCDTDFAKRINISVDNTGGSALTDYQVYVNLSANPINETSIRVYNATGCTLRSHWCENITDGNCTKLWINYSSIAAGVWTNNTAIYYDNVAVSSASSGDNTFEFFDDFPGTSLDTGVSEDVTIENSIFVDNYSCHGSPKMYKNNSNEFWVVWHYDPNDIGGLNSTEGIAMKKIYVDTLSTSTPITWITNYGVAENGHPSLDKFGNKYFAFYNNGSSPSYDLVYKTSSNGSSWSSEQTLESNSQHRQDLSSIQINATTYWVIYSTKSGGTHYLKYRVYDTGTETFGAAQTIRSGGRMYLLNALYNSSTNKYFIYYHDYSTWKIYVISKTGAGAWSSPAEIVSSGVCYASPSVVKMDNGVFLLFYHNGAYDIKVMRGTDGITFTDLKTLKSHATAQCMGSHAKVINSTHIALVYAWQVVSGSDHRIYFDVLEYTAGSGGGKWNEKKNPTVTVSDGICSIYYAGTTDWAGIMSKQSFGAYNYAFRQRVKYDSTTGVMVGGTDAWPGTLYDVFYNMEYNNAMYMRSRNNDNQQQTVGTSERTNYHTDEILWKSGEVKFIRDGGTTATHTTQVPDSALYPYFAVFKAAGSGYVYVDWSLVRKYASPEPSTTLGSEEQQGTNPTLHIGNSVNLKEDWGRDFNSNLSANVTTANASGVWTNFSNAEFTNTSLGNLNLTLNEWVNESHNINAPVSNVSVDVYLNSTTAGATNDTDSFYYEITKRTNIATMDSSDRTIKAGDNFYINATCNEEYSDTFYGSADLLEDGAIISTDSTITDYANFTWNESTKGIYNYTVRFYNLTYYNNITTSTYSNITIVAPNLTIIYTGGSISKDWGIEWYSNISANVTEANATGVWMKFNNTEFTNTSLGDLYIGTDEWVNESHNVDAPEGGNGHYIAAYLTCIDNDAINDSINIGYEITRRTNTPVMDSNATQTANVLETFYINGTCNEEYGGTFLGGARLKEDGFVIDTNSSVTNYVNFSHNESSTGIYNYTIQFYNATHYNDADTPTNSVVTVSEGNYVPPDPTNLANTTGNFWVNHTWSMGTPGNVTNSYNVSIGGVWWYNTTTVTYYNDSALSAHAWNNATVWAYNTSGNGSLSSGDISDNVQIPNNIPVLSGLHDNTTDEDINQTDIFDLDDYFSDGDGDSPTYQVESNNQSAYVSVTINASNNVSYTLASGWNGTASIVINATDGWGGEDNDTFLIIVNAAPLPGDYTPSDPTTLQNTTGNYWINYTWNVGGGNATDSYNVSWNTTWYNTTTDTFMKKEVGASNWGNITVYAFNSSGNGSLSAGYISDEVQAPSALPGDYPPATPTSLANTTGNGWVHYTWSSGGGANATDSYNVSWNSTWYNNTLVAYMNDTVGEFGWANITVYAFNATGNGSLSAGSISDETQAGGGTFTTSMGTTAYNLITYYGSSTSTAEQFGLDIGGVDYIAMYNGSFYTHTMGFSANNFTTYHGIGYYVYLNASGSSTYQRSNISDAPYNTQLFNRWNTIGWTNSTNTNAEGIASSIGSACKYTSSLNADGTTYTTHTVGFTSNNHAVEKGEGYWVWVNAGVGWGRNS